MDRLIIDNIPFLIKTIKVGNCWKVMGAELHKIYTLLKIYTYPKCSDALQIIPWYL